METNQLPLTLRAKRIPLDEFEDVPLRLPKRVAEAVQADPAAAIKAMSQAAVEKLAAITNSGAEVGQGVVDGKLMVQGTWPKVAVSLGFPANEDPNYYTHWECMHLPQWIGFYDVTDHKSGTLNARWWWTGEVWFMGDPCAPALPKWINQKEFSLNYAWRGLKSMPRDPYPVPPYIVEKLPPGVAINGKYVKRTLRVAED